MATDKQIAWANDIRAGFIAEIKKYGAGKMATAVKAGQGETWQRVIDTAVTSAEAIEADAQCWIDNRAGFVPFQPAFNKHFQAAQQVVKAAMEAK